MESKILFTGTSSGRTSLTRHHSSFLIYTQNGIHLVDCGDGISRALLLQNIDITTLSSIIISHFHADHLCGLPLLLTQMKMRKRTKEIKIFLFEGEQNNLLNFIRSTYLFINRLPYKVDVIGYDADKKFFPDESLSVIPAANSHLEKYRGASPDGSLSFYCASFLFEINGKRVHYSGDIGNPGDLDLFITSEPDILITEFAHIKAEDLFAFAKQFPGRIYITHYADEDAESLKIQMRGTPIESAAQIKILTDGDIIKL